MAAKSSRLSRVTSKGAKQMSKLNWNRLGFFILGTFFGSWFLGLLGATVAGVKGGR